MNNDTALHMGSIYGHLEVVKLLLEKGGDPNAKTKDHTTPLHRVSKCGHLEVVKLLIDRGGDPNAKTMNNDTALHKASKSMHGHLEVVKLLIDRGGDLDAMNKYGRTPFIYASNYGHHEVVKLIAMFTGITSQYKLIWAATCMEHVGVYHEFRGTQVVIDLYEYLGS